LFSVVLPAVKTGGLLIVIKFLGLVHIFVFLRFGTFLQTLCFTFIIGVVNIIALICVASKCSPVIPKVICDIFSNSNMVNN